MATVKAPTSVAKNKLGAVITEIGSALFVSAPNPSQFDESKIEAGIVLSGEDFKKLEAQVDSMIDALEEPLVCDRKLCKINAKQQTDQEGNLLDSYLLKSKTGIQYAPKYYDAQNKAFVPGVGFSIPNRSKIRLALSAEVCSSAMFKGLTFKLNGIKIISSNPWNGKNQFEGIEDEGDYAFDANAPVAEVAVDWAD